MATGNFVIYDSITGAIARMIVGNSSLAAANTGAGEAFLSVGYSLASSEKKYVSGIGASPTLSARPSFAPGEPATIAAGATLALDVPEHTVVTIYLVSGGEVTDTEQKPAHDGIGTLDVTVPGTAGDVVQFTCELWPYRSYSGSVDVT